MENQSQNSLNDREREDFENASNKEQLGSVARSDSQEEPDLFRFTSSDKSLSNLNLDYYMYADFVLAKAEKVCPIYNKFRD